MKRPILWLIPLAFFIGSQMPGCVCSERPQIFNLSSVDPNQARAGERVPIVIVGSGFQSFDRVSFRSGEEAVVRAQFEATLGDIALEDVLVVDGNTMHATIPENMPTGTWPLRVGLSRGAEAELPDAITILTGLLDGDGGQVLDASIDSGEPFDGGGPGETDSGLVDAGPPDSGLIDAGFSDSGLLDAGPADAGPPDAGPPDAGPPDAGPPDAGPPDASQTDSGSPPDDAGVASPDAGPGPSHIVAVGSRIVVYSTDEGLTWTEANHTAVADQLYIEAVGHGGGVWLAVCEGEQYLRSTDAVNWTLHTINPFQGNQPLEGVGYSAAEDRWVIVSGGGNYAYSDDQGITWTAPGKIMGNVVIEDPVYHNGRWVFVGDNGAIGYSDDITNANSWVEQNVTSANFEAVFHANGRWMATGDFGEVWYSDDNAVSWQSAGTALNGDNAESVVFGGDRWLVSGSGPLISYSLTGDAPWTTVGVAPPLESGTAWMLYHSRGAGRFLVLNHAGGIAHSDNGGMSWQRADDAAVGGNILRDMSGN
jgi:photosystem II stability/assembly factor-like uncharacterized protein